MRSKFRRLVLALFCVGALWSSGAAEPRPLTDDEKITAPYRTGERFSLGAEDWRIACGKIDAARQVDFDDSKWYSGRVEMSLSKQGFADKTIHTIRRSFDLPAGWENLDLVLDLGFVSVSDETYLNGVKVGEYGGLSGDPRYGASWMRRRYLVSARDKVLRPGRNVLTIFVLPGMYGGMYRGIPSLSKLADRFYPEFNLKTRGPEALSVNLSDAGHLNRYRPGSPLRLELGLVCLAGDEVSGTLTAAFVTKSGQIIRRTRCAGRAAPGMRSDFPALGLIAPARPGEYLFRITFDDDATGKCLWRTEAPLVIGEKRRCRLPVDASIVNAPQRYDVSADSVGHFGPRRFADGKLVDNFAIPDARGTLAFSVRPMPEAPMVLMTNVRPSPKHLPPPHKFVRAAGAQYDGFRDAWIFGYIRPDGAGRIAEVTTSGDWGEKEWSYRFENAEMKLRISTVHPALRVVSPSKRLRLFDRAGYYGTGVPTLAAGMVDGRIAVAPASEAFPAAKLSENWMLVWFSGNPAYREFDIPWLLVFQHRPLALGKSNALEIDFGDRGIGEVLMMPLRGVTLQRPAAVEPWQKRFPESVVVCCRIWSRILAAAPTSPVRTFTADFAADRLTIHDRFGHRMLNDDWKTSPLKIAPVFPLLPLALSSGTLKAALHAPAEDLDYATMHGPLFAIPGDSVTMRFDGLLHYTSEVREVTGIPENAETAELRRRMRRMMEENLAGLRKGAFTGEAVWNKMPVPGRLGDRFSDMLDALRRTDADLAEPTRAALREKIEPLLICDAPAPEWARPLLREDIRDHKTLTTVTSPTGKKLTTFHPRETACAIDSCCWESLRLYALWDYARTCGRWDYLKANLHFVRQFYNMVPNSHDWAVGISYDTFSGLRVGNGLQETGIMHAGMAAAARIAHHFGDTEWRDRAAYYATMQLVGLVGAMSANRWLRDFRPTVAGCATDRDTQYCEYQRDIHYVEFNENGGFTQFVMLPDKDLNNVSSYVMTPLPEVMRPYRELFPRQTRDFFHPDTDRVRNPDGIAASLTPKLRLHMLGGPGDAVREIYRRRAHLQLAPWKALGDDVLPALDSFGKVGHSKLWQK